MTQARKRWPWLVAATLLLLLIVAVVVLPWLLDVERHRGLIERALTDATGWQAELEAIELSVLGGLALRVSPARLSAGEGSSGIEIGEISVRARALPLLRGRLELQHIDLLRPEITLVRSDSERGWVLPETAGGSGDGAPAVSVDRIGVVDGALRIEDRSVEPPLTLTFADVDIQLVPATGMLIGSGALGDGGTLRWRTAEGGRLDLTLDAVPTGALAPWLGPGVLHEGGLLSGDVEVDLPRGVRGTLRASSLRVLAGVQPLPDTELAFELTPVETGWQADKLELSVGEARASGSGRLLPLALDFELPPTPLATALALSEAALPLGLDLEGPGEASVRARIEMPAGGELSYEAEGEITAARFVAADLLPAAEDLSATFELSREGELKLNIRQATVAGGPLEGEARIDSIDPLGSFSFDGKLAGAALGQLLTGFAPDAGRLSGPTSFEGKLAIDLGSGAPEAGSLGGGIVLGAEQVDLAGWDPGGALRDSIRARLGKLGKLAAALSPESANALDGEEGSEDTTRRLLERLSARISFDGLPWTLESLEIASGGLSAQGAGSFDPAGGSVDLELTVQFDERTTAAYLARQPALRRLADGQGRLTLPVRIGGPLTGLRVEPDLGRLTPKREPKERARKLLRGILDRD